MGKPVYTADLMLGDVVVAAALAVQAWECSYDITIPSTTLMASPLMASS